MDTANWLTTLQALDPCEDALEWAETQPSLDAAWATCPRGDWMLWYAARIGVPRQRLVWVACQCARLALPFAAASDTPRQTIETAEAWTRGEASLADVRAAAAAGSAVASYAAVAAAAAARLEAQCADMVRQEWPTPMAVTR